MADRAKLKRLWKAQDGLCYYCAAETYIPGPDETRAAAKVRFGIPQGKGSGKLLRRRQASLEHLKRRADGGTMANTNLVMACKGCNVRRGEMEVEEYKSHVAAIVQEGRHWTLHAALPRS